MAHRLWFRLENVLPLAEHAMACFTHRITGAQALAAAVSGPALIWTGTPVLDLLTSNGVPAWYGPRSTNQAAPAHAWRATSGRYGTAWRDGYHTAYLPLTAHGRAGPVLNLLRAARSSGRRWVTVDIDPTDAHLIRVHRVDVVACRGDLVPAGTSWFPAVVTCRAVAYQPYPALVADGYTSDNGDLLTRFDRSTIVRMAADLDAVHANTDINTDAMPGEYPMLRLRGDVLTVIEEHDNGRTRTSHVTDRISPDVDGCYPLGAYLWPWQLVPTDGRPPH